MEIRNVADNDGAGYYRLFGWHNNEGAAYKSKITIKVDDLFHSFLFGFVAVNSLDNMIEDQTLLTSLVPLIDSTNKARCLAIASFTIVFYEHILTIDREACLLPLLLIYLLTLHSYQMRRTSTAKGINCKSCFCIKVISGLTLWYDKRGYIHCKHRAKGTVTAADST